MWAASWDKAESHKFHSHSRRVINLWPEASGLLIYLFSEAVIRSMGAFRFDVPVLLQESDGQRAKNDQNRYIKKNHSIVHYWITVVYYNSLLFRLNRLYPTHYGKTRELISGLTYRWIKDLIKNIWK